MRSFVHSRALICILAMLLQVSQLPEVSCVVRSGSFSCCCGHAAPGGAGSGRDGGARHGCCGKLGPEVAEDEDEGRDPCTCGVATPDLAPAPGDGGERSHGDHGFAADLPPLTPTVGRLAASKRAELRPIPRARTGPPLFVLYEVYLI